MNKVSVAGSDIGNYDPSEDSYWVDHKCPDCDKWWREDK